MTGIDWEDRAEGIDVSGQDRHVYGVNADSINASAVPGTCRFDTEVPTLDGINLATATRPTYSS